MSSYHYRICRTSQGYWGVLMVSNSTDEETLMGLGPLYEDEARREANWWNERSAVIAREGEARRAV